MAESWSWPHCSYTRETVRAHASLGKGAQRAGEFDGAFERIAGFGQTIHQSHTPGLLARNTAAGEDQVESVALSDQAGQAHGAAVDQRDSEASAEYAEHCISGSDAQIAPEGEFQTSRDRIAFDRGDHGFREEHARGTHGAVSVLGHRIAVAFRQRFQIGARAEVAACAGENRDAQLGIGVEPAETWRQVLERFEDRRRCARRVGRW